MSLIEINAAAFTAREKRRKRMKRLTDAVMSISVYAKSLNLVYSISKKANPAKC